MKLEDMTEEQAAIYRRYAPVEYEKRLGIAKLNHESAQSYARWLLASLLAMNGAALVGIATTGELASQLFATSGLFFTLGIAAALISGLFAWLNWDRAAGLYRAMAEPNMLHGPDWNPQPLPETNAFIDSTRRKSVTVGILSAVFLTLGLLFIWDSVALHGWLMGKLFSATRAIVNAQMGATMTYRGWLEIAAAWSAIATLAIAVFAYGKYLHERRTKRKRLENYLKAEKEAGRDRGQRTLVHLVANVGISESEIMDCAFKSKHVERRVVTDNNNRADAILLEYKP